MKLYKMIHKEMEDKIKSVGPHADWEHVLHIQLDCRMSVYKDSKEVFEEGMTENILDFKNQ